jgi:phosphonate transport system substrate-binding protein
MSTPASAPQDNPQSPPPRPQANFSLRNVLILTVPLALVVGAIGGWFYLAELSRMQPLDYAPLLRATQENPTKLDDAFTDADGDLVADPPKDAAKLVDPETIVFSTLGNQLEREQGIWKEFVEHLGKTTGKKVELTARAGAPGETLDGLRESRIHVAALSTGAVPAGVNRSGFVPFCVMGDDAGVFAYHVEIIVPTGGAIQAPKDLKGKEIALTSVNSLSSFKAPLVTLWKDFSLLPGRDYDFRQVSSQEQAIEGVCKSQYQAASVANDLLRRLVARGDADTGRFRSIYKSPESFPPACFGYIHNLEPELAVKVRKAFLEFDWKGTALAKAYAAANQTRFVAVDYKKDWATVRDMDEAMNRFVQEKH